MKSGTSVTVLSKLSAGSCRLELDLDEFGLFYLDGAEDSHVGQGTFDHGHFVAGVETGAGLAILVDFVGHGVAFGDAEAEVLEKVRQAGEEAGGRDAVVFGLGQQGAQQGGASAFAAGVGMEDDGADLGEVRAVEVKGAAAEKFWVGSGVAGIGEFGDGEVADVLADLGVAAAEEGAVAGEGVDEVEDVAGVLEVGLVGRGFVPRAACLADACGGRWLRLRRVEGRGYEGVADVRVVEAWFDLGELRRPRSRDTLWGKPLSARAGRCGCKDRFTAGARLR